ncbi:MAG: putative toxin-antitoxin system toxin component, PIN family [Cyclobacteriaceae bacterium]
MPKKVLRVVVDTNLWISYLLSDNFRQLDDLVRNNRIVILLDDILMGEIIEVASRAKFKKYFSKDDIFKLLCFLNEHAEFVNVKSTVDLCRDKKDNFLLALAKDGKSDFLITGDEDLLVLKFVEGTKIISWNEFKVESGMP